MNQYIRLIIALAAILGIAGTFILYLSGPLLTGKTIVLATRPVDPFDLFRGQYIVINYEISSVPALPGSKQGNPIYVILKEDENKIWRYQGASLTLPKDSDFIKGTINSIYGSNMQVEYGIEQFFFERDAHIETRNMRVEVKIDDTGQARIKQLLDENLKPINITYRKPSLTS